MFKLLFLTMLSSFVMAGEMKVPLALLKQYESKYQKKYEDFSDRKKSQLYLHAASQFIERKNWDAAHYLAAKAFDLGTMEEKLHSCIIQTETSRRIDKDKIERACLSKFNLSVSEKFPILYSDILRLKLQGRGELANKILSGPERAFLVTEGQEEIIDTHNANIFLKKKKYVESLKLIDKFTNPYMMTIDKVARDMVAWMAGKRENFSCSQDLTEYGPNYTVALEVCGELHKKGPVNKTIIKKFAKSLNQEDFQVQFIIKEFLKI